jgi:Tfp pilus assembly protein PilF
VPPNAHAAANAAPGAVPPNVATTIAPPVQGAAERTTPTSYAEAVAQARQGIQRGDLSAAAASWQEALKFEPESAEAYLGLADARLMTGDAPAAITGYKEAMRLAPKDPVVAKRLGDACFQARQNECAFSAYETAVKGAPVADDGYVWVRYAHVANQIGKKGAARTALAQASKLLPENDRDLVTVKSAIEGQK